MVTKIDSPFTAEAEKAGRTFTEREYISYKTIKKVAPGFDPERPDEFLLEEEVVVDQKIPIDEEINSYQDKVGLKNILKGIVTEKQMNDLISKTKSTGQFIDATKFPDSLLEVEKLAGNLDNIWESIPKDLKGDLTKEEFIKTLTSKKLESYIQKEVEKREAADKEASGGEK